DRAALLHAFLAEPARAEHVDDYIAVFLTKEMAPRKTLITKKLGEANPAAARALEEEQARIVSLVGRMRSIRVAEATEAIMAIAIAILDAFEAAKRARALLDYDDLIAKTRALLTTSSMAPWVL